MGQPIDTNNIPIIIKCEPFNFEQRCWLLVWFIWLIMYVQMPRSISKWMKIQTSNGIRKFHDILILNTNLGRTWAWSVGQSNQMLPICGMVREWLLSNRFECEKISQRMKHRTEQKTRNKKENGTEIRKWTGLFNEVTRIKRNRWNFEPKPNIKIGECR